MESKDYEVEVVHRQRMIYRVRADGREEAERLAAERWQREEPGDVPGYHWCELEAVVASDSEHAAQEQDAELVLRFLRERERLILRLSAGHPLGGGNDAISAAQVASDLGWSRRGHDGAAVADVPRATSALEHLCQSRRVVCFQRPRVRTGERGEIRLYCTPEYLERLSSSALDGPPRRQVG